MEFKSVMRVNRPHITVKANENEAVDCLVNTSLKINEVIWKSYDTEVLDRSYLPWLFNYNTRSACEYLKNDTQSSFFFIHQKIQQDTPDGAFAVHTARLYICGATDKRSFYCEADQLTHAVTLSICKCRRPVQIMHLCTFTHNELLLHQ